MDTLFDGDNSTLGIGGLHEDSQSHLEKCVVEGQTISLPVRVCESAEDFVAMLSTKALKEALTADEIKHLQQTYLPRFQNNEEDERNATWDIIFSGSNTKFGNPVHIFANKLESGWYNPEIARTRKVYRKACRRKAKMEERSQSFGLLQKVIISRQQLIEAASQLPPGKKVKSLVFIEHEIILCVLSYQRTTS